VHPAWRNVAAGGQFVGTISTHPLITPPLRLRRAEALPRHRQGPRPRGRCQVVSKLHRSKCGTRAVRR
jgi:hypothetical protein